MLTGYFLPSSGDIHVKDLSVYDKSFEIKKMLGYLPESAPLYHNMLVADYLNYVANIRGIARDKRQDRIRKLVELCSMKEIMHKTIGELSKGLKQRVGLAHAMMDDPEILVLDEPTSGLDPNQIIEIREIIKQIGKEKTIILSTHILSEAEATCDRIVIINKGIIVADGKTADLKQSLGRESAIYISLMNADFAAVSETLETIEGIGAVSKLESSNGDTLNLKLTCSSSGDRRAEIYNKIKGTDWVLMEFHQKAKTLENVFRELTKEN